LSSTAAIVNNSKENTESQILKIQSKYGFKPVNQDDSGFSTLSSSSDLTLTDGLTYDASTKTYCFTGEWNFKDNIYDLDVDLNDLVAARMINTNGYIITKSYAKTFDNFGQQTGYVDNYGQHSPSDSRINKRFEDAPGVTFNVRDGWYRINPRIMDNAPLNRSRP
jgi:hypothetical protein